MFWLNSLCTARLNTPGTADASQSAWSAGRAALLTALSYLAIPFHTPHLPASRFSTYLFAGLVTISVPLWRTLYAVMLSQENENASVGLTDLIVP